RHRTQRGRVDRAVLAVPHPHLAERFLLSLSKGQHEGRVIAEPHGSVEQPVTELSARRRKVRPLAPGDRRATILDVRDETRRRGATPLDDRRSRFKPEATV